MNIGIDAQAPQETCTSVKCPWHGGLKIRGRVFRGTVVSNKALDTAVIVWDYYQNIPKYERFERRRTRIAAHNPACISAHSGDHVTVAECRPLSKYKRFVIVEKQGSA